MFEAGWVVTEGDKGREEVEKDRGTYGVHPFPDPVGDALRFWSRRGVAFAQGLFYLFLRERGSVKVWGESPPGRGRGFGREKVLKERVVYGC